MTHISIIGNLTSAPELRYTQSGKAVASVTVAVNRKRGETEETDFHRVTLWEGMAENAAQIDKGTRVIVVGRLTSREYQTKDGEKRTGWDITADAFGPDVRFAQVSVSRTQRAGAPAPASQGQDTWNTPDTWGTPDNGAEVPF